MAASLLDRQPESLSQSLWRMMATLRCDQPDIEEFIDAKRTSGALTHFNLSARLTELASIPAHEQLLMQAAPQAEAHGPPLPPAAHCCDITREAD